MPSRPVGAGVLGIFLLACVVGPAWPLANPDSKEFSWRFGPDFLSQSGADFKEIFTAPARWDGGDWAVFAALAGTGVALFAFDQNLYDAVQERKTARSEDASKVISKFGNGGYLGGLMAALYASGELFKSRSLRRTALLSLESFLATSAFVWAGKVVVGRSRPYAGEGAYHFHPVTPSNAHHSLPSGDASGAFAVATVIAAESDGFLIDALAYGMAGLAAVWRVHDRKHWPSDVFVGSVLGIVVGRKVVALNREGGGNRLAVSFEAGRRQSISLSFSF